FRGMLGSLSADFGPGHLERRSSLSARTGKKLHFVVSLLVGSCSTHFWWLQQQAYVGMYQPVVAVSELLAAFDLAPGHPVIQRCLAQLLQLLRRGQFVGVQRQVLVAVFSAVLDADLNEDDASSENTTRVGRISEQSQ